MQSNQSYIHNALFKLNLFRLACKNLKILRLIVTVIVLLVILPISSAQSIEWSNSRKINGGALFTRVLGENANGVYVLRYRNRFFTRNIIIEKYRNHLGFNFSRNILLKRSRLIAVDLNQENLLFFTSDFNKNERRNELKAQFFDNNILPKTKEKQIAYSQPIESYDKGDFRVQSSSDLSKYLVVYSNKSLANKRTIHLKMLDNQMNELAEKHLELPLNYDAYNLNEFTIDNAGNVFLIVKEKHKIGKRTFDEISNYRLLIWQQSTNELRDILLSDSGRYIQNLKLSIDRNQQSANISGYYSYAHQDRFSGLYLCKVNADSIENAKQYYSPIPVELMSRLIGERQAIDKSEAFDFKQLKAIPLSNGSVALISERSSMSLEEDIVYVNGVPQNTSRNIYNFDDVMIVCLDSIGRLIWHQVIHKNQSSLNDGGYYSSIIIGVTNDNIHVIFNDKMRGNGNVLQYSLGADGKMTNKILLKSDREFIAVIPSESLQISSNKLMIPVSKDKKFALLKLVY
jgi:hypothetical protein